MRELNGAELAGFIKERQAKQVRALRQADKVTPALAIVRCDDNNPVIDTYVRIKKSYGSDIGISVLEFRETPQTITKRIDILNTDTGVHGVIVQLPVEPAELTDELLYRVLAQKDVDGLGSQEYFDPATPVAINWLLAGYNIDLRQKRIAIIGQGRLVGAPLAKMWQNSGHEVMVVTKESHSSAQLKELVQSSQIIVTATGQPGLITSDMIQPKTVLVDAGTASEDGVLVGDIADDIRSRKDISVTPLRGGVGPLTVTALFDNVIRATQHSIGNN